MARLNCDLFRICALLFLSLIRLFSFDYVLNISQIRLSLHHFGHLNARSAWRDKAISSLFAARFSRFLC